MDKIREKFHLSKAQSLQETVSLSTMVRDSLYLAWPMASLSEDRREQRRVLRRQTEAIDEEEEDDEE